MVFGMVRVLSQRTILTISLQYLVHKRGVDNKERKERQPVEPLCQQVRQCKHHDCRKAEDRRECQVKCYVRRDAGISASVPNIQYPR